MPFTLVLARERPTNGINSQKCLLNDRTGTHVKISSSLPIPDCISANSEETIPVVPHVALLSIQATSPERRFTQKEIIAGEERPKYLLIKQHQEAAAAAAAVAGKSILFEFNFDQSFFLFLFFQPISLYRTFFIYNCLNNKYCKCLIKEKSIGQIG